MLEDDVEPHATPRLSGQAELVDASLAALARGEGGVLIAEQQGVLGRRALVGQVRAEAARAGLRVVHGRATHVDRVAPLSTLRAALSSKVTGPHGDYDAQHLTALREIRTQLVELANGPGLLVCLDDLHLADDVTALALRMLVPGLAHTPVLWLLSLRRSQASAAVLGVVDVLLESGAHRLPVWQPTEEEVRLLCRRVLGAEPDPAVVAIASDVDGDAERVVRALHDAGHVEVTNGKALLTPAGRALPHWLVTEVRSALGDLAGPASEVLDAGAVLGRRFTVHEAAELLRRPVAELLWAAALLVETGVLAAATNGLTFRSELVRRVVYAGLPEPVRTALHREAAEVVAKEGRPAEEVVHHVERGGRWGSEEVARTLRKAVQDRAGGTGGAARLALRLLDLADHGSTGTGDLTVDAVRLLSADGRTSQAWDLAVRTLNGTPDAATETRLLCALAELADSREPGHGHMVVEYARRASARLDLAERDHADLAAVQAYRLAAAGHTAAAESAAASAGSAGGEAVALGSAARSRIALHRGELAQALDLARAAVHEADRAGPSQRRLNSRLWLCAPLVALDRFDEVHSTLTLVAKETAQLDAAWPVPHWQHHKARAHLAAGRLRSAAADAELAVLTAREAPSSPLLGRALLLLCEIRTALGDLDAAEANLREAERLGGRGAGSARLAWRRVLWLCEADRPDDAAEVAEGLLTSPDLVAIITTAPTPVVPVLTRLARHRDDEGRVDQVVRIAHELSERNPGVLWVAAASAHVRGLRDRDLGALVRAAELYRLCDRPAAAAAAFTDAGRTADGQRAVDLLEQARHEWTAVGAAHRAGRRHDRDPDDTVPSLSAELWASLTETEVRVARLVARGLTNKAIAARLTLSPNTIGTHVRNAFTKLQVTNRVELALQVIAHARTRT
ncbi:LuxR C-terminal-related transcriptional regulator [Lentzea sp. NPDC058436]|uniref:helix-turn-helix transcriptional regulator n=1 Tax=Lentzea sp. NPDC058436 TaxID=3346499 RepID=UPI00365EF64D